MGKLVWTIAVILFSGHLFAQGLMETPIMQMDTNAVEENITFDQTLSFPTIHTRMLFPLAKIEVFQMPTFDFNTALFGKWKQDYSFNINPDFSSALPLNYRGIFPLMHSGVLLNQAAYKVSDKLTFGGNSFGGNSIFSSPLPANGKNNYDFNGASMFIQYKVSKNIKIEAGVSVHQH